ncbi:MAG: cyclic nucleotide-binding domain-containing protein [Waterburya sp.]
MRTRDLVLRTGAVLDIPPRTASLLGTVAAIGVITIVVESLVGNRLETIEVDKILHFMGYASLAVVFLLSLRPKFCIPTLVGLALLSYLIEILQPLNMRSLDVGDAIANTLGLVTGALLGLVIRFSYGYIRTELESKRMRRSLITLGQGTTIVRQGELIDRFFVIKMGLVALYQESNGEQVEVAQLGTGEMFGLLAEILKIPQPTTVVALTPVVQIYPLDYDELIKDFGGHKQPLGILLRYMASKLGELGETIVQVKNPGNDLT